MDFWAWRTNTEISSFHVEARAGPYMVKYCHGVSYPPDSPTHTGMFCTTDLCWFLAHWLFSAWLADSVIPCVPSQWFSPLCTLFWVIVESWREDTANIMNQSLLQQFCFACRFRGVRKGFPLLHSAIFSSFISVGLSQVAILWSRNLQFYLLLCLFVQHCTYYLVHLTCLHDILLHWSSNLSPCHLGINRLLNCTPVLLCLGSHYTDSQGLL